MKTTDFDYFLPEDRIAAFPSTRRDGSRLMRLGPGDRPPIHSEFAKIGEGLPHGALIVLNDTRVIPARLLGRKPTGGAIELLLTRRISGDAREMDWEALGRNLGWAAVGSTLSFEGGLVAELIGRGDAGAVQVRMRAPAGQTVMGLLERVGQVPLPPYIEMARRRHSEGAEGAPVVDDVVAFDRERYQTVYAGAAGAVAAPTAGLHFTEELLRALQAEGHQLARLTLHVGPGTFRPVKVEAVEDHVMDEEVYTIPAATADAVNEARRSGRPVVAVGTTVVRALESAARAAGAAEGAQAPSVGASGSDVAAGMAASRLFLRPGDQFHVVTDMITNFHLPRSTLLMLVAAFAGRERILAAYAEAVAAGYRFYSYGDAMLIRRTP